MRKRIRKREITRENGGGEREKDSKRENKKEGRADFQ
jgi:hypothetical protein